MAVKRIALIAAALGLMLVASPAVADDQWALELSSVTPSGANFPSAAQIEGASANGRHVFFRTAEALVPEDQNGFLDLYDRHDGTTELISTGPSGNGYGGPAILFAVSGDGQRVIFETADKLVPEDDNGSGSLYQRYQGTTTLIAKSFQIVVAASDDASVVYFNSTAQLVPEDTDTENDLYKWDGSSVSLVSGPGMPIQSSGFGGFWLSRDGTRAYFSSSAQLVPADTDNCTDLYSYSSGVSSLISSPTTGNCPTTMQFLAESRDGTHVVFATDKVMTSGPCCTGLWEHSGGQNQQIGFGNTNTFNALSDDGARVFFTSGAQLYVRDNGQYTQIPGTFRGIGPDGTRVFFETSAQLLPEDQDMTPDIYVRDGSYTELITSNLAWDSRGWNFVGVSADGGRAFFSPFVASGYRCLHSHAIYSNANVNTGLCAPNPEGPVWRLATDGTRAFLHTSLALLPADDDTRFDVYAANLVAPAGFPRPRGATPLRLPLVPAFSPCTSPNRTHGAPLSFPSCSAPTPFATSAFIGIGDGNPAPAKSIGSVVLKVVAGASGPPDDSDVRIDTTTTNVMKTSDRSDYTGELRLELPLRITDHANSPTPDAATVSDTSIFATVPCAATVDTTVGSTCSVSTTVDTLLPGAVPEGARSVWAVDRVRVQDGGADGVAATAGDNEQFSVQGVFVP